MRLQGRAFLTGAFTFALAVFWAGDSRAEEVQRPTIPNYRTIDPIAAKALASPSCPSNGVVAFTVEGQSHVSQGAYILLGYPITRTNVGGGWVPGGGSFIAPCTGLYSFTVMLLRDPYYNNGSTDDVYSCFVHNGVYKGCAWAGESTTTSRGTGTYTLALVMNQGDYLQTFVGSDSGVNRFLSLYNLTGFLVRRTDTPNP